MPNLYVIKIGGNVIDDPAALREFLENFVQVKGPKALVHGGGKVATRVGEQMGLEPKYVNGRRITDEATRDLVTMVYGGLLNKQIVAGLQALGCNALGLTGVDGNVLPATKRPVGAVDFGWVGDVSPADVGAGFLEKLLDEGVTPVLAPLTHDRGGHILNTNADTIASSIAVALSARFRVRLIYCFEKKGVLNDLRDDRSVIPLIDAGVHARLLAEGRLADGILPKIDNAFAAIRAGVREVLIGDARDLLSNTSETISGTMIK